MLRHVTELKLLIAESKRLDIEQKTSQVLSKTFSHLVEASRFTDKRRMVLLARFTRSTSNTAFHQPFSTKSV